MADIQQWRKKIQPSKARTPLEPDDMPETPSQTVPPKRCLKKKVSSYFDLGQNTKTLSFHEEAPTSLLPTWPVDELYPEPKAEDEMDSVMRVLMSEPYARLDVRYNSSLMRIFEAYATLKDEKLELEQKVQESTDTMQSVISEHNMAQKDWEDKKQDYKDEIKRLEVLLAKSSKRGLAEVTLARQDSKLRSHKLSDDDHKETIFEFLEKTNRHSSRLYDNQRATMKPLIFSPSDKDRKWSQKLSQKKSMTNIHADLPFGTPPDGDMRFSLTQASFLEQQAKRKSRQCAVTTSTTESDDTFSSFACEGETLPQVTVNGDGFHKQAAHDEFGDIGRLADALAQRRNIHPSQVMPKLLEIFDPPPDQEIGVTENGPNALGITAPQPQRNLSTRMVSADNAIVKRKSVVTKASDLFHKLRPQLGVENASNLRGLHRRFSFEPGDDAAAQKMPQVNGNAGSGETRILRKSVSLDVLGKIPPTTAVVDPMLSPVPSSSTVSVTPADGRPPSRIPTPVYSSGSLARPRQEREDSASSLLTAFRQPENTSKRSNSVSSSAYSIPSPKPEDPNLSRASQPVEYALGTNLRLLDRTNSLRSSSASLASHAVAGGPENVNVNSTADRKRPGTRSNHSHSGYSDKSNSRSDSLQPIKDPTQ
ncbi:hypothetical protein M409DRAFT_19371 [Zasmidium cellare ATCC 36951]|uniref:Uncharacterized protein n=1 Tax=Zasmidium cellare ATCC 36951 TaxID=1080233 RepID=A0A6A6CTY7_ZASCE|nr:uncharacterized protein M409DRAFT_19371 [Zasmidium cellare ATCC 36951]KAF2170551.1 hypothetical protein M409DRAFT_19371 [Zasmidium cellare ATCC 36951]